MVLFYVHGVLLIHIMHYFMLVGVLSQIRSLQLATSLLYSQVHIYSIYYIYIECTA